MALEAIIAVNLLGYIGKDDVMLWHDKEDLKRFKELTMGRTCIVGRKTFDKLPPLPGRKLVVVSRSWGAGERQVKGSAETFSDLQKAIEAHPDAMIIGGAQIYEAAAPYVKRWHITLVDDCEVGDTRADFLKDYFTWNSNT